MKVPSADAPGALEAVEAERVGQAERIGEDLAPRLERGEHHPGDRHQHEDAPERDDAVEHDVGEAEAASSRPPARLELHPAEHDGDGEEHHRDGVGVAHVGRG